MKLRLSRIERIKYLGYDDWPWMLLFIPLLSITSSVLFIASKPEIAARSWWICFAIGLAYTLLYWTINRYWIIWLRMRFPRLEQTKPRIVRMLVFAIGTVWVVEFTPIVLLRMGFPDLLKDIPRYSSPSFDIIVSIVLCLMVIAIYESIYFFKKYSDSLVEREKLAKANMHAQLSALKQQVNPHFLFNSLNTLANVIPEDPKLAVIFVQRLSAVYRRLIDYRHRDLVSLEEELIALKDYVFLLNARFEDKFCIHFSYQLQDAQGYNGSNGEFSVLANNSEDEGRSAPAKVAMPISDRSSESFANLPSTLKNLRIPPLSLQLLVENTVKHNVVSQASPLVVNIEITPSHVEVSNPLNLRIHREESTGLGHQNIRQRYRLLTDQEVVIKNDGENFKVTLPLLRVQETYQHATA
ncbi:hypothetical protein CEQ90_10800 [Lewinellaceae bacterium SD302]|nr:hypothetical protein CEQ90_10800 [Lewinellaceae bacterium SD302]